MNASLRRAVPFLQKHGSPCGCCSTVHHRRTTQPTCQVFALGKWQSAIAVGPGLGVLDVDIEGSGAAFLPRVDSQDAWIFRSPLKESVASLVDFEMGRPRYSMIGRWS